MAERSTRARFTKNNTPPLPQKNKNRLDFFGRFLQWLSILTSSSLLGSRIRNSHNACSCSCEWRPQTELRYPPKHKQPWAPLPTTKRLTKWPNLRRSRQVANLVLQRQGDKRRPYGVFSWNFLVNYYPNNLDFSLKLYHKWNTREAYLTWQKSQFNAFLNKKAVNLPYPQSTLKNNANSLPTLDG